MAKPCDGALRAETGRAAKARESEGAETVRYTYAARSNEFMLDLDSERAYGLFLERLPKVLPLIRRLSVLATRPHHFHVYGVLRRRHRFVNLSALQTFLRSDPIREVSNMSRMIAGASKPIILIEFSRVPNFRGPDLVCACKPKLRGKKFANCLHLMAFREHKPKYGFLSTRVRIVGVEDPFG